MVKQCKETNFENLMKVTASIHMNSISLYIRRQVFLLGTFPRLNEAITDFAFRAEQVIQFSEMDKMSAKDHILHKILEYGNSDLKSQIFMDFATPTLEDVESAVAKNEHRKEEEQIELRMKSRGKQSQISTSTNVDISIK